MAQPSVDARPALWAGTSNPMIYRFSSSNFAQDGYRLVITLYVNGSSFRAANFAANPITGRVLADVAEMLKDALDISGESDLTLSGDQIYLDTNSCVYNIRYQEIWDTGSETQVDDVANLRYAIKGGFQIGQINDYSIDYTSASNRKLLTKGLRAVKNKPFLFSYIADDANIVVKLNKYAAFVFNSFVELMPSTAGVQRVKIQETGDVDEVRVALYERALNAYSTRTLSVSEYFFAAGHGNGLFVLASFGAAAALGNIITSPEGINWTSRTSPSIRSWVGHAYGAGLHVLVSFDGTAAQQVATSPDGITWTHRTAAANLQWVDLCFGNNLFVAIANSGAGNRVMTSPDGINWTSRTSAADNPWQAVTWVEHLGLFMAVASGGAQRMMVSSDGITWTGRTIPAIAGWTGIDSGKGIVVVVATGTPGTIITSYDGLAWTQRTNPSTGGPFRVKYGGGIFLAAMYSGAGVDADRTIYSYDGVTWINKSLVSGVILHRIAYDEDNRKFLVVAGSASINAWTADALDTFISDEIKSIEITEPCNELQLTWKNKVGGDECYPFSYNQLSNWNYTASQKAKRLTLFAQSLTEEQWSAIQDMNTPGEVFYKSFEELLTTVIRTSGKNSQDARILNADGTQIGVVVINQNVQSETNRKVFKTNVLIELPEEFTI